MTAAVTTLPQLNSNPEGRSNRRVSMLHAALTGSPASKLHFCPDNGMHFRVCRRPDRASWYNESTALVLFLPPTIEKLRIPHQTRFYRVLDSSRYCTIPACPRGIFPFLERICLEYGYAHKVHDKLLLLSNFILASNSSFEAYTAAVARAAHLLVEC